jgi:hypothetical protein
MVVKSKNTSTKPLLETRPLICALIAQILAKYRRELGLSRDPKEWAAQTAKYTGLAPLTVHTLLGTHGKYRKPSDRTIEVLEGWFAKEIRHLYKSGPAGWLDQSSEQDLENAIADAAKNTIDVPFSIPQRPDITKDLDKLGGIYISYRFAFEPANFERQWVREVVIIESDKQPIKFTMSFKIGANDGNEDLRLFEGYVLPLGRSLMCVGVHCNPDITGSSSDSHRGRCLFLNRSIVATIPNAPNGGARFGILASTRGQGEFEPSAACTLLIRANHLPTDLREFMHRSTVIRPSNEIMRQDFKDLPPLQERFLRQFLDNIPIGNMPNQGNNVGNETSATDNDFDRADTGPRNADKEQYDNIAKSSDGMPDLILKLDQHRFLLGMPAILRHIYQTRLVSAPFNSNWSDGLLTDN